MVTIMPGKKDPNWEPGGGDKTQESTATISGTSDSDWVVLGADETSSGGYDTLGAIVGPHDDYEINLGGGEDVLWIDLSAYDQSEVTVDDVVEGKGNKGDTLTYTVGDSSYELTLKSVESVVILTSGDVVPDSPIVSGGTLTFDETFVANGSLTPGDYTEANYTAGSGLFSDSANGYQFMLESGATYVVLQTTSDPTNTPLEDVGALTNSGVDSDTDLEFRIYTDGSGYSHEFNLMLATEDFVFAPGDTFTIDSFTLEGLDAGEVIEIYSEDASGTQTSTYLTVGTDITPTGGSYTFEDDLVDVSYFNVNLNGSGINAEIFIDDINLA